MNRQIDTQISNAQLLRLPRPTTHLNAVELVQDVIGQYPFRSPRERESVELALEQDFGFLGSRAQFSQVLVNLIKNALHALAASGEAPKPGDLRIAVTLQDDRGQIVITDRGTGIPLQKQHRIFEPFFSLQSSVGNGLGLTFCKNVVEASDGGTAAAVASRQGRHLHHRPATAGPTGTVRPTHEFRLSHGIQLPAVPPLGQPDLPR